MIVRIARVKVGNRQAPQQHTETPPDTVGFLCLHARHPAPTAARPPGRPEDGRGAMGKHSICTVADYVDAREDGLLANGIDV